MFHGNKTSGINLPVWYSNCKLPQFPSLNKDLKVDVCIIGGGIVGLGTAYQLCKAGKSVVVLEDGEICSGETGRTTAHLTNGLDDRYYELERVFGKQGAKLAAQSHTQAIDTIEAIVKKEKIVCEFARVDSYLFLEPKDKIKKLEEELAACHRVGLKKVELIKKPQVKGIKIRPCLRFPNQAQFHPLKYLAALSKKIIKMKGKIFENTHAKEIKPGKISKVITNKNFKILAKHIVIATNSPIYDKAMLFAKQEPKRTYVIGIKVLKNSKEKALFWDTAEPYHFIRVHPHSSQYDIVSVGGEDHRTGETFKENEKFKKLETWAHKHISGIKSIEYRWSGQVMEPVDHLAFIGKYPNKKANIYVATGDSGNGLTHGTIASLLIKDLILKRKNPWEKIYKPTRKPTRNVKSFISNMLKTTKNYVGYITPGQVKTVNEIKPGTGAIVRKGATKIAVYCDAQGKLHPCSAICPHMKGILAWNATEHSWDCPVHGSRFSPFGDVINGPSIKSLDKVKTNLKSTEKRRK